MIEPTTASQVSVRPVNHDLPVVRIEPAIIHAITEAECVDFVMQELAGGRGGWILTLNVDHLRLLRREPWYAELCAKATLTVADGMPLVWSSRLQGTSLPERVTGSSLIFSLTSAAAAHARSIFLLGGAPGTASASAVVLQRRYPCLRVAGTRRPVVGFENRPGELEELTETLTAAAPDIVYVALGKPKQELMIDHFRVQLPKTWFVGVGVSFSFVCRALRRAPLWMQHGGLEWLHRLAQEPNRLAMRYIGNLPFTVALLGSAAVRRWTHQPRRRP